MIIHMPFHCVRCRAEIDKAFRACPHCGEPVTEFQRRYADEPVDGKYRIVERLGAGGMGDVYKVEHTFLGTIRVIKVIRPQIQESRDAHDRFLREARAATKVQHPNVATMHDFAALPDGSHYMVWEYIDGENVAQRLRTRGPLPPRQAVQIAIQALHGLEAIHRAGIIHRDVSPENLMIAHGTDAVKIIDLGVAKVDDPSEVSATRTGIFVGKLRYAAPEQLGFIEEGAKIDARADVYAMGMVLYELLTGRPPYEAKSPHEYFVLHAREAELQPVELPPDLPGGAALQDVLRRALARDRNQRWTTARDFAAALETIEQTLPDPRSMPTLAIPLDADATMRMTPAPAAPTVRTPMPMPVARPVTRVATRPAAIPAPKRSRLPFIANAIGLVFAIAIAALLLTRGESASTHAPLVASAATTTTAAPETGQPAGSSFEVTTTTAQPETPPPTETTLGSVRTDTSSTAPLPAPPTSPRTTTMERREPPPPLEEETEPEAPAREEAPVSSLGGAAYVEGGDEDQNEAMVARLKNELAGVQRIAVRGGLMQLQLAAALRHEFPNLEVVPSANVVIRFDGTIERLGRGRKRREAHAAILKNGRVIFRYDLPSETYRVGSTPVEAFVSVLGDAF
ncbi:MAG: eukaryotic-like serine/threonine-protein kinase [Acidobacteriota bacterium]|nr:eukaryotic-like serine/threonine-protein kinase [Acidobacteriota bacterium]